MNKAKARDAEERLIGDGERLVEAVLFASPQPVSEAELRRRLPPDVPLDAVLERLVAFYDARGVKLKKRRGHAWAFDCTETLGLVRRHEKPPEPKDMPWATTQVLAVIAWGQPISIGTIDARRGVRTSSKIIQELMDQGWIEKGPLLQEPGNPVGWVTTPAFLERLGLDSLADLPDPDELERGRTDDSGEAAEGERDGQTAGGFFLRTAGGGRG